MRCCADLSAVIAVHLHFIICALCTSYPFASQGSSENKNVLNLEPVEIDLKDFHLHIAPMIMYFNIISFRLLSLV